MAQGKSTKALGAMGGMLLLSQWSLGSKECYLKLEWIIIRFDLNKKTLSAVRIEDWWRMFMHVSLRWQWFRLSVDFKKWIGCKILGGTLERILWIGKRCLKEKTRRLLKIWMVVPFTGIEGREVKENKVAFALRWFYDTTIGEELQRRNLIYTSKKEETHTGHINVKSLVYSTGTHSDEREPHKKKV